jgi:hypothetical protein
MNIFKIVENIYTNRNSKWIYDLGEEDLKEDGISTVVLQKILGMNDLISVQVRFLDKYTFHLPVKMFISLAWSIIPKYNKNPFIPYIKKKNEEDEYDFILPLVRKHLGLSDNDYKIQKQRIIDMIKRDKVNWFSFYGIKKIIWKRYNLDFNKMKEYNKDIVQVKTNVGLAKWGIS